MVYAIWHGGYNYMHGNNVTDLEQFETIRDACDAFRERYRHGDYWRVGMAYVNREPEAVMTPGVDHTASMWVWLAADEVDGVVYVPEYPDRVVSFGPRGGVRVERA